MRIVARAHLYAPEHCAGAEMMLAALLTALADRGHDVSVLLSNATRRWRPYEWGGVTVFPLGSNRDVERVLREADVAVTHLDCAPHTIRLCHRFGTPLVQVCHNDFADTTRREIADGGQLLVFNSRWLAASLGDDPRGIVVPPPVIATDYATSPGRAVTLVNLMVDKGADTFWQLARRLPHVSFLGVEGAYGRQVVFGSCPNVTVQPHTPDMRSVYSRTRVLLMPSSYESWGRVGVEAMFSGIPVIAHPTAGLRESLGDAGIFVDRDDVDKWEREVRRLITDAAWWQERSDLARERAAELDPADDLARFCDAVEHLAAVAA